METTFFVTECEPSYTHLSYNKKKNGDKDGEASDYGKLLAKCPEAKITFFLPLMRMPRSFSGISVQRESLLLHYR